MPALVYDYAIVRVMPRVERGEFVNAGVIVSCHAQRYLAARVVIDVARWQALHADVDVALVRDALEAIPRVCAGGREAGPLAALSARERFHWLTALRSTVVQTSPVHSGWCGDPVMAMEHLLDRMVR